MTSQFTDLSLNNLLYYNTKEKWIIGEIILLPIFTTDYSDSLLLCDGTSYSRTEYNNLFSIIGTNYGFENSSTFKIPNLKMAQSVLDENKYYIRGRNNMTTISSSSIPTNNINKLNNNHLPSHNHNINSSVTWNSTNNIDIKINGLHNLYNKNLTLGNYVPNVLNTAGNSINNNWEISTGKFNGGNDIGGSTQNEQSKSGGNTKPLIAQSGHTHNFNTNYNQFTHTFNTQIYNSTKNSIDATFSKNDIFNTIDINNNDIQIGSQNKTVNTNNAGENNSNQKSYVLNYKIGYYYICYN